MHDASFKCRLSIRDNHLIFLKSARPRRREKRKNKKALTFCGFRANSHKAKCLLQKFVWCKRHLPAARESLLHTGGVRALSAAHTSMQFRHRSPQHPRSRLAWMTLGGLQCTWLFLPFYFLNRNDIEDRGSVAVQGRGCPLLSPGSPAPSLSSKGSERTDASRLAASHFFSLLHSDHSDGTLPPQF